ncbi:Dynein light chain LC8-type [Fasciolopsis buskii]|uniref:Dynein light chain n=1 Tax=Fasciolopsis buskii TaxID=27845 RepID=A0A8E0RTD1_9TREM|nr:Dynein light chain LC8-type [Fasciolopsis buski]
MSELVLQRSDMKADMRAEVTKLATELWHDMQRPRKVAEELKKYMDSHYKRAWHCIVGRDFNSFISYETGTFMDFMIGDYNFILYKNGH